ncbi:MAG: outer membrane lipid asymmetry maintenance protein MlaD [Steroidobacteraceae bacterium]
MSRASRSLEIGTGLFVLLGFAALAFLTTQLPGSGLSLARGNSGFRITARFGNVGDLKVGAPVSMAGVRVGRIETVGIDPMDFKAVVVMRIEKQYDHIPDDSDASIQTAGLLGAKYVGLGAGGSDTYLKDGSEIPLENTQSAIVLESLVNKLFASIAGGGKKDDAAAKSDESTKEQK